MKLRCTTLSDEQIKELIRMMHGMVYKMLLYKDRDIKETIFYSDEEYDEHFKKTASHFSAMNDVIANSSYIPLMLVSLQAAYNESKKGHFNFRRFRKELLDTHGYIDKFAEEVLLCQA